MRPRPAPARFLADENVDRSIVEVLRLDGHDVHWIAELATGVDDDTVLGMAESEQRILLTADKDFGELVFRVRRITTGVVLVRLAGLTSSRKAEIVSAVVGDHLGEMPGAFTVIEPGHVRIRHP